tara:strand:- start:3450 stop:4748 length:1299 start_codon:yes stop_codon:yes gene_type:complete
MPKNWKIKENVEDVTFQEDVKVLDNFIPDSVSKEIQDYAFNKAEWQYTNQSEGQDKSLHWGSNIVAYPNPTEELTFDEYTELGKKDWAQTISKCPAIGEYWKFLKKHSPVKQYLPDTPSRGLLNCSTGGHGDISHLDHSDNLYVVTHILYLNDDLDIDDGGQTEFYTRDRSEIVGSISPKLGRVVILDARIPHAGKAPWPHYTGRRITLGIQCYLQDGKGNPIKLKHSNKTSFNMLKRNRVMQSLDFKPESWIGKFGIPNNIVSELIETTDKTLLEKKQRWGDNLAGRLKEEWLIHKKDVKETSLKFLMDCVHEYLYKENRGNPVTAQITSMWLNEMKENEYNPLHQHDQHLSAVFYLKVPELEDRVTKKEGIQRDGYIEFVYSKHDRKVIKPVVGDLYIFPADLPHCVYPFRGKGVRRSVSFNVLWGSNNE